MKVSPSILTCDFTRLGSEVARVAAAGADMLHLDVMDGVFVPNLTFGPPIVRQLRPLSTLPFDVHLMLEHPERLLEAFVDAGADSLTIHLECSAPIAETLRRIRSLGRRTGLSIRPSTPVEAIFPYLDLLDQALIMTVEPGFGGQSLMPEMLRKVTALREETTRRGQALLIEIDGGVNEHNAKTAAAAGATAAVIGNAFFAAEDPAALVASIQAL